MGAHKTIMVRFFCVVEGPWEIVLLENFGRENETYIKAGLSISHLVMDFVVFRTFRSVARNFRYSGVIGSNVGKRSVYAGNFQRFKSGTT